MTVSVRLKLQTSVRMRNCHRAAQHWQEPTWADGSPPRLLCSAQSEPCACARACGELCAECARKLPPLDHRKIHQAGLLHVAYGPILCSDASAGFGAPCLPPPPLVVEENEKENDAPPPCCPPRAPAPKHPLLATPSGVQHGPNSTNARGDQRRGTLRRLLLMRRADAVRWRRAECHGSALTQRAPDVTSGLRVSTLGTIPRT